MSYYSIIIFKNSEDYEKYLELSLEYHENEISIKKYENLRQTINFYCPYYENLMEISYELSKKLNDLISDDYPVSVMEWSGSQKNQQFHRDWDYDYSIFHLEKLTYYGNTRDDRLKRITRSEERLSEIDLDTIKDIRDFCQSKNALTSKEKIDFLETMTKLQDFSLKIEDGCKIYFLEKKYHNDW